jgi:hypothetical protein
MKHRFLAQVAIALAVGAVAVPLAAAAGPDDGYKSSYPQLHQLAPSGGLDYQSGSSTARAASPRSGALHVTKECSEYTLQAGSFCTITSSNVKAIPVGSKVIYKDAAVYPRLDTDIVLSTGPGNSAYGHVVLNLATGVGTVTFYGGTGQFRHFHASQVDVTPLGYPVWAWDGAYSFSPRGDE